MTLMRRINVDHRPDHLTDHPVSYRKTAKLAIFLSLCALFVGASSVSIRHSQSGESNCIKCHRQSTGRASEVVKIHLASTHGKSGAGCGDCHGGNPSQEDKTEAHSANFIGKPDRPATLAMCGDCHQPQLAQFKSGRHFPEKHGMPRLDCSECHGAHSIGNPPESFSLAQFCVSCHGLEYLPPLPQEFQELLNLADDLHADMRNLRSKGRQPSDEMIKRRKEIRGQIADIVHPTDRASGLERIPRILSQGERLKQQFSTIIERRNE